MTSLIPEPLLETLSGLISRQTGLHFPGTKYKTLSKGISAALRDLGMEVDDLVQSLRNGPPETVINALTSYLTIGETYFLRDKNFFQILQDHILRGIITHPKRAEKRIIFWSAGCATGEEPYSIAILMDGMRAALKTWDIRIIGSDINPAALAKAREGLYSTWSLRETPEKIIKKYFTPKHGGWFEIAPQIRRMVEFRQLNLMEDRYDAALSCYEPMDVVLCRNVLMYFNDMDRNAALEKLSSRLIENGWLITGPAESGFVNFPEFTPVRFPGALYHRKGAPRLSSDLPTPMAPRRQAAEKTGLAAPPPYSDGRRITDFSFVRQAPGRPPPRAPEAPCYDIFQEAVKDYDRGDYSGAIQRLQKILRPEPDAGTAFLMKTDSMMLMAKAHANIGDLDQARTWCEKAIETEKLNPELYYLLATLFQSAGDRAAAIRSLKQSLYLDPDFIMAHFSMGMLLLQDQMQSESRRSMRNAKALLEAMDPEDLPACSEGMTAGRLLETLKSMKII